MMVLSYEEEKALSLEERRQYYIELKNYLSKIEYTSFSNAHLAFSKTINKEVKGIVNGIKGYELTIDGRENIPKSTPVIYASTHQDFYDHFNAVLSIPEHVVILNSKDVNSLFKLLMWFNCVIYVDRNDPTSRFNSKIEMMKCLSKGQSILVFPEATYNCSPNKLCLPLYMGVVDMARKMNVPIVPLVQEYTYNEQSTNIKCVHSCHARFGSLIEVHTEDDLEEKLEELEESFSSGRLELIEEKGMFTRNNISNQEYINYLLSRMKIYEKNKIDIDSERKMIYGFSKEQYAFMHINDIPFDAEGNLLDPVEVTRLRDIGDKNLTNYCFDRNNNFIDANKMLKLSRKRSN